MTPSDADSTNSPPPSSELRQTANRLVREIATLYQSPPSLKTPEDVKLWTTAWIEAVIDETKDAELLMRSWTEFKRTYDKPWWPTPGMLCHTIRKWRADHKEAPPRPRSLPAPDYRDRQPFTSEQLTRWQQAMTDAELLPPLLRNVCMSLGRTIYESHNREPVAERWRPGAMRAEAGQ